MNKCIGCGAHLQNTDKNKEGYTKDLTKKYCERCFRISHYNEYSFKDKDGLDYLEEINKTKDLVILLCDFLNTDFTNLKIDNPILLVLAKRDIIPRSLDETKLLDMITPNLNIVDKITICSKNNYNLDKLYTKINKHKKSQNAYIIGFTSAGKSTLINKIAQNYGEGANLTTSILPSTTLDKVTVKINETLTLIDTPGLLDKGSYILNKSKDILNQIMPKKEIKPVVIQAKIPQTILTPLFRIDISKKTNLIFYMSNNIKIDRIYKETNKLLNKNPQTLQVKKDHDLVIKGVGFIKFTCDSKITLYLPKEVDYNIRKSII